MAITRIPRGNDFRIKVNTVVPQYEDGQITVYEDFDLSTCTNLETCLVCQRDQVNIPIDIELDPEHTNRFYSDIQGKWLHLGQYGIFIQGLDANGRHWRFKQKTLFIIVDNTSEAYMNMDLMENPLEVQAEIGMTVTGPQGATGPTGPQGEVGPTGPKGEDGSVAFDDLTPEQKELLKGDTGATGAMGVTGAVGPQGETGATGPQGEQGPTGPQGEMGVTGAVGPQGETGATGPQGEQGPTGPQGETGATGPAGQDGVTGAVGPQGATGAPGTTDYNDLENKPDLSAVATSGDYNDLSNTPTIPTDLSDLNNDTGFITASEAPVTSVNGMTGNVVISVSGVTGMPTPEELEGTFETTANALYELNAKSDIFSEQIENLENDITQTTDKLDETLEDVDNKIAESESATEIELLAAANALANHEERLDDLEQSAGGGVESFNGMTGVVTYEAPVTSVNGMTGAVTIQTGGDPGFIKVGNGIVNYNSTGYDENLGNRAMIQGEGSSPNYKIKATGYNSHAEGERTQAIGPNSHAEGYLTKTNANNAHAEGSSSQANAQNAHAEGYWTQANNFAEHASGHYNSSPVVNQWSVDGGATAIISSIGNGSGNNSRHNAFEVRQNGDIYYSDTEKIDGSTVHYYDAPMRKLQDAMVTSATNGLKIELVATLPQNPDAQTIYIIS